MHEQVGWRGLVERLKQEAPRYAKLLPELPRLVHHRLQHPAERDTAALLTALLAEQRRTNRLLQSLVWGGVGFVLGAVCAQLLARWHGF
jgi:ubiquinone biosynthesis protein